MYVLQTSSCIRHVLYIIARMFILITMLYDLPSTSSSAMMQQTCFQRGSVKYACLPRSCETRTMIQQTQPGEGDDGQDLIVDWVTVRETLTAQRPKAPAIPFERKTNVDNAPTSSVL
jgi:hypothetical protein